MFFIGVVVLTTTQLCVCDPYYTTTSPTTNDHKLLPNPFLNHPEQHTPPLPVLLLQQPPHDQKLHKEKSFQIYFSSDDVALFISY